MRGRKLLSSFALLMIVALQVVSLSEPSGVIFSKYTTGLVKNVSWGPGDRLAVVTTAGKVIVFDGTVGQELWESNVGLVERIAWSPNGLLALSTLKGVKVFDSDGNLKWELSLSDMLRSADKNSGGSKGEIAGLDWVSGDTLAVLVMRIFYVKKSEGEGGTRTYTSRYKYTLYAYKNGVEVWSAEVGETEQMVESKYVSVQARGDYVLVKIPDQLQVFKSDGEKLWGINVSEPFAFNAALSQNGLVAMSTMLDGRSLIRVLSLDGREVFSTKECYLVEKLEFSGKGDLIILCNDKILVYGEEGRLEWKVEEEQYDYFLDFSVGPQGDVAVAWRTTADFDVYHAGSKSYYTFKGGGIRVYSKGGTLLRTISGCNSAWSNDGKLAVWCSGFLRVYDGDRELWHKTFLGSVEKISFSSKGDLAVIVNPLSRPVFLSLSGEYVWNFSDDIRVSDAFFENNYLVILGYDDDNSYIYVYDSDYRELLKLQFGKQFLDENYYEIVVPVVSINNKGKLAVLFGGEKLPVKLLVYNISSKDLLAETELGQGQKPIKVSWINEEKILFLTSQMAGIAYKNGSIVFQETVSPPDINLPDICLPDDEHAALLSDGILSLYSIKGKKLWDYMFHVRRIACSEGRIAAASYYSFTILDLNGEEIRRDDSFVKQLDAITHISWRGDRLFVGTESGKLLAYSDSGEKLFEIKLAPGVKSLAWGPENMLAAGTEGGLFVIDLKSLRKVLLKVLLPGEKFTVTVDGKEHSGPKVKLELAGGIHEVEVPQKVLYNGCEYVFREWSDGINDYVRKINLENNLTLEAKYDVKRCLVEVESSYSIIEGVGWHEYGSTATLKVKDVVVDFGNGTRVVFTGWSNGVSSQELKVEVEGPVHIKAMWKRQYLISVTSSHGSVEGGGWYDEGTVAKIIVKNTVFEENGKRFVFDKWLVNGKEAGREEIINVKVTEPLTIEAVWKIEETPVKISKDWLYLAIVIAVFTAILVLWKRKHKVV